MTEEKKCECGCGKVVKKNRKFISGHNMVGETGVLCRNWHGGIKKSGGYIKIYRPDHINADKCGYVYEHNLIIEKAIGKPIPLSAEPHHINGCRNDNKNNNLVLCQNHQYHQMLHQRQRALETCGHANWLKCWICKKYDSPDSLIIKKKSTGGNTQYHHECNKEYQARWARENRRKKNAR